MKRPSESPIIAVAARALAPVIQLIALYVIFHGHASPGGGFQGGVLLAASFVLIRLGLGNEAGQFQFPSRAAVAVAVLGVTVFAGVGFASLAGGGNFLDHGRVPLGGLGGAGLRSLAILAVEVGVAVAVPAVLIAVYDALLGGATDA